MSGDILLMMRNGCNQKWNGKPEKNILLLSMSLESSMYLVRESTL